ncbi:3426_t:CDS:2 [Gigaspora rosea]|nr:3426_t:CDS:2 [Gigaspora rosea]
MDAQEETVGRHIKQGQNRQITLAMCFENSMKFYAQLKATKEKNNASKNCKKEIVMSKKQCQLKKINEKIQRKLVDFFHLKNKHTELSQTTIVASKFQNPPNSASSNGSTAINVNHLELDLSQECSNNPPDLNGANTKKYPTSSKKRLVGSGISYWQNRDDQQMPLGNSYHLSNFSGLTDDSFITTSSRLSAEITSDRHPRKSSKNIHCGNSAHDKEFEKGSSIQISNSSLQNNMNPLLKVNDDKHSLSMKNSPSLVATSKSVSRRMAPPDKNLDNAYLGSSVDNDNHFELNFQEHKENVFIIDDDDDDLWFNADHDAASTNRGICTKTVHESQSNFNKTEDLDSNIPTRSIKLTEQNETLDIRSKQETLFCSTSLLSASSSFFSQSQIIDEMDHQVIPREIPRSRTPDFLAIQERLIKSGISPAPSPPPLLSQGALEQISLSTLEQMPSLNMCTLQFDDFDDLF